jgi:purine-binding chemotaxis protein CheW
MNSDDSPIAAAAPALEILAFALGEEEYGIDIQSVRELRGYDAVTRIASAPPWIKGVVNLRGAIVPIIDLRVKLSLGEPRYDQFTVVVVVNVEDRLVGLVVDGVSDVLTLFAEQIKPAPQVAGGGDHILGLATQEERMLILVDIAKLVGEDVGLAASS